MNPLTIKLAVGAVLLAAIFGLGWHLGGLKGQADLARLERDQAQTTATAVLNERASALAELTRLQKVVAGYENAPIDPISVGIGHRVFLYAGAAGCPVPQAAPHPDGALAARPKPSGFEDALQGFVDACSRDARRLDALIEAWPR